MSGRHIGTYKAACKAPHAFEVISGIMNMTYKGGISLPRWQNIIFHMNQNTELGNSMVSLLETFHLSMEYIRRFLN